MSRSHQLFFLPTVCYTIPMMLVWKIWYWINTNPLTDIFLYTPHLSA